ncbi:MAG TPA: hypothetical protein VF698_01355 [Thermoanaerobaculia bacterium]|jgi:hypothetical protein
MPVATTTEEHQTPAMSAAMKRSLGEDVVPSPGHSTANLPADYRTVNGWGADLDHANRPSYPKELPSNVRTARGEVRDWQVPHTKVHVSNEHPNLTPAFGASVAPKGLSGMLRDYAYEFGEATNRHWMTLVLADRVDMVESMITSALRGKPDNYIREKGWTAYLTYDPARRRKAMLIGATAIGAIAFGVLLSRAMRDSDYD